MLIFVGLDRGPDTSDCLMTLNKFYNLNIFFYPDTDHNAWIGNADRLYNNDNTDAGANDRNLVSIF
jgi:hypothetical protein